MDIKSSACLPSSKKISIVSSDQCVLAVSGIRRRWCKKEKSLKSSRERYLPFPCGQEYNTVLEQQALNGRFMTIFCHSQKRTFHRSKQEWEIAAPFQCDVYLTTQTNQEYLHEQFFSGEIFSLKTLLVCFSKLPNAKEIAESCSSDLRALYYTYSSVHWSRVCVAWERCQGQFQRMCHERRWRADRPKSRINKGQGTQETEKVKNDLLNKRITILISRDRQSKNSSGFDFVTCGFERACAWNKEEYDEWCDAARILLLQLRTSRKHDKQIEAVWPIS